MSEPALCKRCGATPVVEQIDGACHIHCEGDDCGLMFLNAQEGMTTEQTIEAWNGMMADYGKSWSY